MVILLALLTVILLVLLVLGLHRYQLSVAQSNADKHDPLPPLTDVTLDPNLPDFNLDEDLPAAELSAHTRAPSSAATVLAGDHPRLPDSPSNMLSPAAAPAGSADSSELTTDPVESDQPAQAIDGSRETSPPALPTSPPEDPDTLIELPPTDPNETEETSEPSGTGGDGAPGPTDSIATGHTVSGAEAENAHGAPDEAPAPEATNRHRPPVDQGHNVDGSDSAVDTTHLTIPDQPQHFAAAPLDECESWQGHVAELKKRDSLEAALQVCEQAFPLWSAYQQATLIHRARIKQLAQDGKAIDRELKALYRLAAQASFLHDRVKGLPNLPLSQLKKVDLDEVASLDMPYEKIGYNELRLIKKTDIKLLLESWGKPHSHLKPRELHADTWKNLIARRQTTLF